MSNILFIAGGPWQLPYIKYLKSKNQTIYVVNPWETQATKICDYHIKCDIAEINLIYDKVKDVGIRFVTSDQSDVSTIVVAKLSKLLDTRANPVEVIEKFSNKWKMVQAAEKYVPVPKSSLEIFDDFPIISKPVDATNSRGFRKINNSSELRLINESISFSPSKTVIIQKYVEGDEQITLDGVCNNYKHKTLAVSQKGDYFKPGLTRCVRYPARIPHLDKIIENRNRFIENSGLEFGLTHGEYIVNTKTNEYWFIECAARGAGAGITSSITPWVSGVNPYDILYQSLLGEHVDVRSLKPLQKSAILQFYSKEEVPLDKTKEIKAMPGVAEFLYDYRKTEFATDSFNCRHTLGIYLAENDAQLDYILNKVQQLCQN
jgi:biotin carboxylase